MCERGVRARRVGERENKQCSSVQHSSDNFEYNDIVKFRTSIVYYLGLCLDGECYEPRR
jgi:hypothetical protein